MEIGITGGEEDGVDNTGMDQNKLYTQPEQVSFFMLSNSLVETSNSGGRTILVSVDVMSQRWRWQSVESVGRYLLHGLVFLRLSRYAVHVYTAVIRVSPLRARTDSI